MTPEKAKEIDLYRQWIIDTKKLVENCKATLDKIAHKQGSVQQVYYDNLMIAEGNELFERYVNQQLNFNLAKLANLEEGFGKL
jgi:hypothetical protein